MGQTYQDIQSQQQPFLHIVTQSWVRLGICSFVFLAWGSWAFAFFCVVLLLFFKLNLLFCQPSNERGSPEVSFALQSLFGSVPAVGLCAFAEFLEDGRVAVERKKEALSAPTVLCPKLRRKLRRKVQRQPEQPNPSNANCQKVSGQIRGRIRALTYQRVDDSSRIKPSAALVLYGARTPFISGIPSFCSFACSAATRRSNISLEFEARFRIDSSAA